MKINPSIVVASTLGATFADALALTIWPAIDASAIFAVALVGGFLAGLFQKIVSDPRAYLARVRYVVVGSLRLTAFLAPQLLAAAATLYLSWRLKTTAGWVLDDSSSGEVVRWWFAACATLVSLMFPLPVFLVLLERRPFAMFEFAGPSDRVRAVLAKAGIFKSLAERRNMVLVGRAPAWRTPFRSNRFSLGDYLVAGARAARVFGLASGVLVVTFRGIERAFGLLIEAGYGPTLDHSLAAALGSLLVLGTLYQLVVIAWAVATSAALKLRERASLCAGAGGALGSVAGLVASAWLHVWHAPLLAVSLGAFGGALCGLLAIGAAEAIYRFAARFTPRFVAAT